MNLKRISIILLLSLVLVICYSGTVFAESTSEPYISITSDATEYHPGETIELSFYLNDVNQTYTAWNVYISKIDGFTYDSYFIDNKYNTWNCSLKGKTNLVINATDSSKVGSTENGLLFKIKYKISETITPGEYSVKVKSTSTFIIVGSDGIYFDPSYNLKIVSGSSEPTESSYSANITTDKTTYNVGDTVKLTAALTPAQAASLASGSMKISYDKDALDFSGAVSANDIIRATAENGTAVASFTTEADKALSVSKDTSVELATFSFTAKKAGTADFEVTEAIADEAVDGALKSAVVNKPESKTTVTIEAVKATCDSYGSDYKLVKYVSDSLPQEGKAYAIGGSVLSYVPAYSTGDNAGKYVFVGLVTETPADLTVSEVDGNYDTIQATGDANGDKATNITDAQTVIYMIASKITSASEGAYDWLNSDVNGDGVINALDAQAIQYFVHYGEFGQFN